MIGNFKVTSLGVILALSFSLVASAKDAEKKKKEQFGPELMPQITITTPMAPIADGPGISIPENAGTPDQIQKDYDRFTTEYRDLAGLFTADDFRSPGAKKLLEKMKYYEPETQAKLGPFKKKLDALQTRMRNLLSLQAVMASETQFPRIYNLAKQAAAKLELGPKFKIFILRSPVFNAFTYSYNNEDFDVVLHTAAVENLSDDAILALFGHEMGHVKDQAILMQFVLAADFESKNKDTASATHMSFYDKMFEELPPSLRNVMQQFSTEIVAQKADLDAFANDAQATEFTRNCEITADRAAVVVTGDVKAPLKLLSALAYGSKALSPEFNQDELIKQIRDVLASTDNMDDINFLVGEQESHPFSVLRLVQVSDYAASDSFAKLKARMEETAYNKELETFIRIYTRAEAGAGKFKKYLEDKGDTDDTLVLLKAKDQFSNQLKRMGKGLSKLGYNVIVQLMSTNLASPKAELFDAFVAKVKADKENALKAVLVTPVLELLKKKADEAKGDDAAELKVKIKVLEGLKELE